MRTPEQSNKSKLLAILDIEINMLKGDAFSLSAFWVKVLCISRNPVETPMKLSECFTPAFRQL